MMNNLPAEFQYDKRLYHPAQGNDTGNDTGDDMHVVCQPLINLKSTIHSQRIIHQLPFGTKVKILEHHDRHILCEAVEEAYIGYCEAHAIGQDMPTASHIIHRPFACLYDEANDKAASHQFLPYGAQIHITEESGRYYYVPHLGWVHQKAVRPICTYVSSEAENLIRIEDIVRYAMSYLHTPYLWGGASGLGIDCSALIQKCFHAIGVFCYRDSDMQEADLRFTDLPDHSALQGALQAGDLIFWRGDMIGGDMIGGHVAMMMNDKQLIHANASDMEVAIADYDKVCYDLQNRLNLRVRKHRRFKGISF
jgi:cell wall-associated NlpC family hydrolase